MNRRNGMKFYMLGLADPDEEPYHTLMKQELLRRAGTAKRPAQVVEEEEEEEEEQEQAQAQEQEQEEVVDLNALDVNEQAALLAPYQQHNVHANEDLVYYDDEAYEQVLAEDLEDEGGYAMFHNNKSDLLNLPMGEEEKEELPPTQKRVSFAQDSSLSRESYLGFMDEEEDPEQNESIGDVRRLRSSSSMYFRVSIGDDFIYSYDEVDKDIRQMHLTYLNKLDRNGGKEAEYEYPMHLFISNVGLATNLHVILMAAANYFSVINGPRIVVYVEITQDMWPQFTRFISMYRDYEGLDCRILDIESHEDLSILDEQNFDFDEYGAMPTSIAKMIRPSSRYRKEEMAFDTPFRRSVYQITPSTVTENLPSLLAAYMARLRNMETLANMDPSEASKQRRAEELTISSLTYNPDGTQNPLDPNDPLCMVINEIASAFVSIDDWNMVMLVDYRADLSDAISGCHKIQEMRIQWHVADSRDELYNEFAYVNMNGARKTLILAVNGAGLKNSGFNATNMPLHLSDREYLGSKPDFVQKAMETNQLDVLFIMDGARGLQIQEYKESDDENEYAAFMGLFRSQTDERQRKGTKYRLKQLQIYKPPIFMQSQQHDQFLDEFGRLRVDDNIPEYKMRMQLFDQYIRFKESIGDRSRLDDASNWTWSLLSFDDYREDDVTAQEW